tara:strand:+ start:771 stop:1097 length:327 start_codon:yes stop_codon:yes gene_type:complete
MGVPVTRDHFASMIAVDNAHLAPCPGCWHQMHYWNWLVLELQLKPSSFARLSQTAQTSDNGERAGRPCVPDFQSEQDIQPMEFVKKGQVLEYSRPTIIRIDTGSIKNA